MVMRIYQGEGLRIKGDDVFGERQVRVGVFYPNIISADGIEDRGLFVALSDYRLNASLESLQAIRTTK